MKWKKHIELVVTVLLATAVMVVFRQFTLNFGRFTFVNLFHFENDEPRLYRMTLRLGYDVMLSIITMLYLTMIFDITNRFLKLKTEWLLVILALPFLFYFSTFLKDMSCVKPLRAGNRFLIYTLVHLPWMILCAWILLQRNLKIGKKELKLLAEIFIVFTLFKFTRIALV